MRVALLLIATLAGGCVSPFPIRTCQDAKRAVVQECGHADVAEWTCWDEISLRGAGDVLSEELYACLDGATTCFEVDSCLGNHGLLEPDGVAPEDTSAPSVKAGE